jgi:hypothetical protein
MVPNYSSRATTVTDLIGIGLKLFKITKEVIFSEHRADR